MLWNNLVAAFEPVSIFGTRGRLYILDVSTAIEECMVRRIKQNFIQKSSKWIEIGRRYISCKLFGESVDRLVLRDHVLLPRRSDV